MSEVVQLYKCDECGKVIIDPTEGRRIQGNIYVADPTTAGGLVGNNFPKEPFIDPPLEHEFTFTQEDVCSSVYCIPCFMKIVLPDLKIGGLR